MRLPRPRAIYFEDLILKNRRLEKISVENLRKNIAILFAAI
jgi:hypothetical protein